MAQGSGGKTVPHHTHRDRYVLMGGVWGLWEGEVMGVGGLGRAKPGKPDPQAWGQEKQVTVGEGGERRQADELKVAKAGGGTPEVVIGPERRGFKQERPPSTMSNARSGQSGCRGRFFHGQLSE